MEVSHHCQLSHFTAGAPSTIDGDCTKKRVKQPTQTMMTQHPDVQESTAQQQEQYKQQQQHQPSQQSQQVLYRLQPASLPEATPSLPTGWRTDYANQSTRESAWELLVAPAPQPSPQAQMQQPGLGSMHMPQHRIKTSGHDLQTGYDALKRKAETQLNLVTDDESKLKRPRPTLPQHYSNSVPDQSNDLELTRLRNAYNAMVLDRDHQKSLVIQQSDAHRQQMFELNQVTHCKEGECVQ